MSPPANRPTLRGFAPLYQPGACALLLGSMPSQRSLQAQQYYGHPRNRFWPLMNALLGIDARAPYLARTQALTNTGLAVWDVLAGCQRPGSLDADIRRDSELPNPLQDWLAQRPTIHHILFNGRAAETTFRRHFPDLDPGISRHSLPSTSPANARFRLDDLIAHWQILPRVLA